MEQNPTALSIYPCRCGEWNVNHTRAFTSRLALGHPRICGATYVPATFQAEALSGIGVLRRRLETSGYDRGYLSVYIALAVSPDDMALMWRTAPPRS